MPPPDLSIANARIDVRLNRELSRLKATNARKGVIARSRRGVIHHALSSGRNSEAVSKLACKRKT